ncbi:MAG: class I SAM-dependent methyltransferase [Simkania negevensis]|nr:class I SAM-dependent methyltransferase [Simkania negevensis]
MSDSFLSSPVLFAHHIWKEVCHQGDIGIDATCGNGHDSLFLANLLLSDSTGELLCLDIQQKAIHLTQAKLKENLDIARFKKISFHQMCHSNFPSFLPPSSVKIIAYNLGFLPGGNKGLTTQLETTLESLQKGLELLLPGGILSITCYVGHPGGKKEEEGIIAFARSLSKNLFTISHQQWLGRKNPPSLLFIQKQTNSFL